LVAQLQSDPLNCGTWPALHGARSLSVTPVATTRTCWKMSNVPVDARCPKTVRK
jgi:hypothetical protein